MYLTEYSNTDCEGDITSVSGVPVGVCLIQYNANNKAIGSVQYNCNEGTIHVLIALSVFV